MGGVATTNAIFKPIYYSRSLQLDMSANAPFPEVGALCKNACTQKVCALCCSASSKL